MRELNSLQSSFATTSANNPFRNYLGEQPIVWVLFWLKNHDHWQVSGIDVIRADSNASNQHMVKMTNGIGWSFTDSEVSGANSENGRAVNVGTSPSNSGHSVENVVIRYNTMHNNLGPSNVQLAWQAPDNQIYRNIMSKPRCESICCHRLPSDGHQQQRS